MRDQRVGRAQGLTLNFEARGVVGAVDFAWGTSGEVGENVLGRGLSGGQASSNHSEALPKAPSCIIWPEFCLDAPNGIMIQGDFVRLVAVPNDLGRQYDSKGGGMHTSCSKKFPVVFCDSQIHTARFALPAVADGEVLPLIPQGLQVRHHLTKGFLLHARHKQSPTAKLGGDLVYDVGSTSEFVLCNGQA